MKLDEKKENDLRLLWSKHIRLTVVNDHEQKIYNLAIEYSIRNRSIKNICPFQIFMVVNP